MTGKVEAFDSGVEWFKDHQTAPWARLRYSGALANLGRHLDKPPLRILDAGGGNGLFAIPLATEGHHVTLVDFSAEMLADAERNAAAAGVAVGQHVHHASLDDIPMLFPEPVFDVVICHMVLQYIDDAERALHAICQPLIPNGIMSIMNSNRYAQTYQAALLNLDLDDAYAKLNATTGEAFGLDFHLFTAEEMIVLLEAAGCSPITQYGVLNFCAYIANNDIKYDPAFFAQLEQLEYAAADRYPYYLVARFSQFVARKKARSQNVDNA